MRKLSKSFLISVFCLFPVLSYAVVMSPEQSFVRPILNEVSFQTSAEGWVASQTAEVTVNVNASLTESQLAKAHSDMLSKLNNLVKADWHITQFNRMPNQSGLEQLQITATARLPEEQLINIRSAAKKISTQGETFTVGDIVFTPTLADTMAERETLREQIYQDVLKEQTTLNKIYSGQHFIIHQIDFRENVMPQPQMRAMVASASAAESDGSALSVQNKMVITANVSLASVNQ